jgi:hypothetical protein
VKVEKYSLLSDLTVLPLNYFKAETIPYSMILSPYEGVVAYCNITAL